jgi:hypothetical protein
MVAVPWRLPQALEIQDGLGTTLDMGFTVYSFYYFLPHKVYVRWWEITPRTVER